MDSLPTKGPLSICQVAASELLALRQVVLRPQHELAATRYACDEARSSLHLAARAEGQGLVAAGTILEESRGGEAGMGHWRIRGMAVLPSFRGQGLGSLILRGLLAHAEARAGALVWCNARLAAVSLYERQGMVRVGEEFELADIGLHFYLERRLR